MLVYLRWTKLSAAVKVCTSARVPRPHRWTGFDDQYTSDDVFSRKGVHFGGRGETVFHLWAQTADKNPILGAWIGVEFWSLTRKVLKLAYYRNYRIDSNQILHDYKDHQMPLAGTLDMRVTNPRWRTADILRKKSINRHTSAKVWLITTKIWHGDASRTL